MRGIIATVDGAVVDVQIIEPAAHYAVLIALLDAAGNHKRSVQTTTHHGRTGFRVPRDLAERAGLLDTEPTEPDPVEPEPEPEPEPTPAPKKAAAKKAPAKAAAKPAVVDEVPAVVDEVDSTGDQGGDSGGE